MLGDRLRSCSYSDLYTTFTDIRRESLCAGSSISGCRHCSPEMKYMIESTMKISAPTMYRISTVDVYAACLEHNESKSEGLPNADTSACNVASSASASVTLLVAASTKQQTEL